MQDEMAIEGEGVRPFTVPISKPFAKAAARAFRDLRLAVEGCFSASSPPHPKSPLVAEMQSIEATPDPVGTARASLHLMLMEMGELSWYTALDLVRSLEHEVVRRPPPVWSPLILSRSVLENCVLFHYLFDPSISGALRLARGAGLWRKDVENTQKAAIALGPEREQEASELDAYITQSLVEADVKERLNKNGRVTGYSVDQEETTQLDFVITQQVDKALPSWIPRPYGLLSGAAHGRPWMTERARTLATGSKYALVGEAATIMTAFMVVVASLEAALLVWRDYFGFDLGKTLQKLEEHRDQFFHRANELAHGRTHR